jgi:putative hydrolase of the HAD superfamily
MIRTIAFDLGGVIITIEHERAVGRFRQLGIADAAQQLDPYTQGGPFGALERGDITPEEFRQEMSRQTHREVSSDECAHAWMGYMGEVPTSKLDCLRELREEGYRLILLSNTNPFIAQWAESPAFDRRGNALGSYFDASYKSFEIKAMKPDPRFFEIVEQREQLVPRQTLFLDDGPRNIAAAAARGWLTMQPANGSDWTSQLRDFLDEQRLKA